MTIELRKSNWNLLNIMKKMSQRFDGNIKKISCKNTIKATLMVTES